MNKQVESFIIIFLLISIIWLLVSAIISLTYGTSPIWLYVFIVLTILYVPIMLYYGSTGRINIDREGVDITIISLMVYLLVEMALAVVFLVSAMG